ncbi:MAG: 23S rRNA (pseudouridine(1915)-N(3))-methyltransferase RlmH [Fusobacteriota bacterium]
MVKVNIICVGKVKEKYLKKGLKEYLKRLQPYANTKIIEVKDNGNEKNPSLAIQKEEERILKQLDKNQGYNILLDLEGKMYSSEEMAKKFQNLMINRKSTINLIIGGSYGVSKKIKKISNIKISFSKLTFPHQLMRLIVVEQVYRWFSILNNGNYHK